MTLWQQQHIVNVRPQPHQTSSHQVSKQAKLPDVMLAAASKRVPQTTVDKLIINFICESVQPFTVVEQLAFKESGIQTKPDRLCELWKSASAETEQKVQKVKCPRV